MGTTKETCFPKVTWCTFGLDWHTGMSICSSITIQTLSRIILHLVKQKIKDTFNNTWFEMEETNNAYELNPVCKPAAMSPIMYYQNQIDCSKYEDNHFTLERISGVIPGSTPVYSEHWKSYFANRWLFSSNAFDIFYLIDITVDPLWHVNPFRLSFNNSSIAHILSYKLIMECLGLDRRKSIDSQVACPFVATIKYRSTNMYRNLWGGQCVSSWWHLVWFRYLLELCSYISFAFWRGI